jgi:hypothetical protein
MKFIVIAILNLLLLGIPGKGQTNEENLLGKYCKHKYIKPELRDSFAVKFDSFTKHLDSLKIKRYFPKSIIPPNQYFSRKPFNEDNMVIVPLHSNDKMPNANIAVPGVHYLLKIVPGDSSIRNWNRPPYQGLSPQE